jgi:peroxiredoxin Q/BCP
LNDNSRKEHSMSDEAFLHIKPGDLLPQFSLPAHDPLSGTETIFDSAAALARGPLVLFYYPKADTPGCTRESILFTERLPEFAAAGATVVGASRDTVAAQCGFASKYSLGVPLLSDAGLQLRQRLGNPDGSSPPLSRITYVVRSDGLVAAAIGGEGVTVDEHVEAALAAVQALAAGAN